MYSVCLFNLFNVAIFLCLSVYCKLETKIVFIDVYIYISRWSVTTIVILNMYEYKCIIHVCMLLLRELINVQNVPEISCMYCLVPNSKSCIHAWSVCACMLSYLLSWLSLLFSLWCAPRTLSRYLCQIYVTPFTVSVSHQHHLQLVCHKYRWTLLVLCGLTLGVSVLQILCNITLVWSKCRLNSFRLKSCSSTVTEWLKNGHSVLFRIVSKFFWNQSVWRTTNKKYWLSKAALSKRDPL